MFIRDYFEDTRENAAKPVAVAGIMEEMTRLGGGARLKLHRDASSGPYGKPNNTRHIIRHPGVLSQPLQSAFGESGKLLPLPLRYCSQGILDGGKWVLSERGGRAFRFVLHLIHQFGVVLELAAKDKSPRKE